MSEKDKEIPSKEFLHGTRAERRYMMARTILRQPRTLLGFAKRVCRTNSGRNSLYVTDAERKYLSKSPHVSTMSKILENAKDGKQS